MGCKLFLYELVFGSWLLRDLWRMGWRLTDNESWHLNSVLELWRPQLSLP